MTWFFAFLVVGLLGAVAVVAAGRGGAMTEVYDDRPDSRVQADGPLTAEDLRRVRFSTAFRGYRMSEVDSLLDRLAVELDDARRAVRNAQTSPSPQVHEDGEPA
ncbi:MAG TPA: DivIVA domain-containing protein [Nocardioides sp.]|nr:DivIVA domain-containing protein [Nocardioides sp.]